jgi:hypothetical protein
MHPGEKVSQEITITNNIGDELGEVKLAASTGSGASVSLSKTSVRLKKGESTTMMLDITPSIKSGSFEVKVLASAPAINISDELVIPVKVSIELSADMEAAKKQIDFAQKLLNDNPECLDMGETLAAAALYIDSGKYYEAETKAKSVVSGCSGLMALRGTPTVKTEVIPQLDVLVSVVAPLIAIGLLAAAGISLFMVAMVFGKKKPKIADKHQKVE